MPTDVSPTTSGSAATAASTGPQPRDSSPIEPSTVEAGTELAGESTGSDPEVLTDAPAPLPPYLGREVRSSSTGSRGTVDSYHPPSGWYGVLYDDGSRVKYPPEDAFAILFPPARQPTS